MDDLFKKEIMDLAKYWADLDKEDNCIITSDLDYSYQEILDEHLKMNDLWDKISEDKQDEALVLFREKYFGIVS